MKMKTIAPSSLKWVRDTLFLLVWQVLYAQSLCLFVFSLFVFNLLWLVALHYFLGRVFGWFLSLKASIHYIMLGNNWMAARQRFSTGGFLLCLGKQNQSARHFSPFLSTWQAPGHIGALQTFSRGPWVYHETAPSHWTSGKALHVHGL